MLKRGNTHISRRRGRKEGEGGRWRKEEEGGGVLTVVGDVDGSLSERRCRGEEGQREEEEEDEGEAGGARPPIARPPAL